MKRFALASLALVVLLSVVAFAQEVPVKEPTEIDPAVVETILAGGLLGVGVMALVQIIKGWLKIEGIAVSVALSLAVSAVCVAAFLIGGGGGFVLTKFIGYTVAVWAVANGWYKFKKAE